MLISSLKINPISTGESYGYDEDDSSSDSDNEMLLRYEHYVSSAKDTGNGSGLAKKTRGGSFRAKSSSSMMNGGMILKCIFFNRPLEYANTHCI